MAKTTTPPDPEQAELDRLRQENEALRRKVAEAAGLDSTRGRLRIYRIKLQGLRPLKTMRSVQPRHAAPASLALYPARTYEDVSLFVHEGEFDPLRLEEAAWKRYVAEGHNPPLDLVRDRRAFSIEAVPGKPVDYLDVPAISPADAFETFKAMHGITATVHRPEVEALPDDPLAAAGK